MNDKNNTKTIFNWLFCLLLILVFCMFIKVSTQPAHGYDVESDLSSYDEWNTGPCGDPKKADRWILEDMAETHGKGTYKFSYWNSRHNCSNDFKSGTYTEDRSFRVEMEVEVLGKEYDNQERITIKKEGWIVDPPFLMLHDTDEPGVIWIKSPGY